MPDLLHSPSSIVSTIQQDSMASRLAYSRPLTYKSLDELDFEAEKGKIIIPKNGFKKANLKKLALSLKKLDETLKLSLSGEDEELAYIFSIRFVDVFSTIYKQREYMEDDSWYNKLSLPTAVLQKAEIMKENLKKRYEMKAEENDTASGLVSVTTSAFNQATLKEITNDSSDRRRMPDDGHGFKKNDPITMMKSQSDISASDLNSLLKKRDGTLLILDVRDSSLFDASHLMCENVVNIPGERLTDRSLTVSVIENILDPACLALWRERHTFDLVVIVDKEGARSNTIVDLVAVLTEYSFDPVKNTPVLLTGGFYGFITRFPQGTSDPHHKIPRIEMPRARIADIRYPSVNIFNDLPDPVSPEVPRKTPQPTELPYPRHADQNFIDSVLNSNARKSFFRRPSPNDSFDSSHTPAVAPISFRSGTYEPQKSGPQLQVVPNLPTVNRQNKPAISSLSAATASKSESSFDGVVNNPNVTTQRGSMEIKMELSDEDVPRLPAESKFVPYAQRDSKPPASNGVAEKRSLQSSFRPTTDQQSRENGYFASNPSSSFNGVGQRTITKLSPSPPTGPLENGFTANGQDSKDIIPKVRNIPINVEKRPATIDQPPEIRRVLKPTHNLSIADIPELPPGPLPSELEPSAPFGQQKMLGYTGLVNLGNTCYMNAVLQCLAHTRPVREYYKTGKYKTDVCFGNPKGSNGKISVCMAELMKNLWSGNYRCFSPKFMKNCLATRHKLFQGNDQQDGHEALTLMLEMLHQDTNVAPLVHADDRTRRQHVKIENLENLPPSILAKETIYKYKLVTDSLIDSYLTFLQESVVQCCHCGFESYNFCCDQMLILGLGHPETGRSSSRPSRAELTDLLAQAMQADSYNSQIEWTCPKCKCLRSANQGYYFNTVPRILAVQLKRFQRDGLHCTKDERFVNFEHKLSLAPFCKKADVKKSATYRLYAVLDHLGGDLNSGHYTASVLHCDQGADWLKCDDETVSRMSPKDVVTSNAYVLFYERQDFSTAPF